MYMTTYYADIHILIVFSNCNECMQQQYNNVASTPQNKPIAGDFCYNGWGIFRAREAQAGQAYT